MLIAPRYGGIKLGDIGDDRTRKTFSQLPRQVGSFPTELLLWFSVGIRMDLLLISRRDHDKPC
jgi:hypothetical protein